jgi:hypothetical protein
VATIPATRKSLSTRATTPAGPIRLRPPVLAGTRGPPDGRGCCWAEARSSRWAATPLPHRAERVDCGLLQRVTQPAVQLLGDRPGDSRVVARRRGQRPLIRNRLDGSTAWTLVLAGPPTSTAMPSTSPDRAYRTVTCRPSTGIRWTRSRPPKSSAACGPTRPGRPSCPPGSQRARLLRARYPICQASTHLPGEPWTLHRSGSGYVTRHIIYNTPP